MHDQMGHQPHTGRDAPAGDWCQGHQCWGQPTAHLMPWARLSACQHLPPLGKIFLLTSDFFQSERCRNLRQTKTTKIPSKVP